MMDRVVEENGFIFIFLANSLLYIPSGGLVDLHPF